MVVTAKKEIGQVWISRNDLFCKITSIQDSILSTYPRCGMYKDANLLNYIGSTGFTEDWLVTKITKEKTPEYFL